MARRKIDLSTSDSGNIVDMKTKKPVKKPVLPVICERVRFYREKRGLEQKTLAGMLGITPNTVSNWENGRSRPDVNLLPGLCSALGISFYDLFHMDDPTVKYTEKEQLFIGNYRKLNKGHQYAVESLTDALLRVQEAESCPDIRRLTYYDRSLAAGSGDPTEFEENGEALYVYPSPEINKADCVFTVNGNSMEPDFHSGDMVLVKRASSGGEIHYGDIGAFMAGNETYIKQYQEDGLHSLNPHYKTMRFCDEQNVFLIGRVIGVLDPKSIAGSEDVEKYEKIYGRPE